MNNRTFAYTRVSTKEQSLDRQINAIKNYCFNNKIEINERDIFQDKISGKNFCREQYTLMKQCLREGDVLIVKELDRLGRNKNMIKEELDYFKSNKIRVKILNIPTTLLNFQEGQEWILEMVNNILLEVLSTIAEEERVKLLQRQKEGLDIAKAKGKHLGRPKAVYPADWEKYYTDWKNKKITAKECMENLNLKRTTFYKLVNQYK